MRQKLFALVDANNFYVSCERAFSAALHNKPVIVLSNNDGCVVARSNDVKKFIKMGQPVFEIVGLIEEHHIQVFSSNYSLYADMSARFMAVLREFSPRTEMYSIDESWLDLTDLPIEDLTEFGRQIKARVWQYIGIPVSVGIGSSKTLAKIATELVKQDASYEGVLDLTALAEDEINTLLDSVAVKDVWGIGRKYALFLENYGIQTAKHLKDADEKWIRKYLSVVGERTVVELRGTSCIPLESDRKPKQAIMCAKTFGRDVLSFEELAEIIATYTARCAEKLRSQESLTTSIGIFIQTNRFNRSIEQYQNSFTIRLPHPTAFTPTLIKYALEGLKAIYRDGYKYKKAGVSIAKIVPEDSLQPDLFGEFSLYQYYRQMRLMCIVDAINRIYGRDTLFLGSQGITRTWKMRQFRLSPRYTTQWNELFSVTTE